MWIGGGLTGARSRTRCSSPGSAAAAGASLTRSWPGGTVSVYDERAEFVLLRRSSEFHAGARSAWVGVLRQRLRIGATSCRPLVLTQAPAVVVGSRRRYGFPRRAGVPLRPMRTIASGAFPLPRAMNRGLAP